MQLQQAPLHTATGKQGSTCHLLSCFQGFDSHKAQLPPVKVSMIWCGSTGLRSRNRTQHGICVWGWLGEVGCTHAAKHPSASAAWRDPVVFPLHFCCRKVNIFH